MANGKKLFTVFCIFLLAVALLAACGGGTQEEAGSGGSSGEQPAEGAEKEGGAQLSGDVKIDGSSTVYPITEAVAEEFMAVHPDVNVTVNVSGTGGGFKKWVSGETDINDASRPIKEEEAAQAKENGIEPVEIPVAYDGITVVVNPQNDWVDHLTVEELKKIWEPNSKVKKWSDIRPDWPNEEIKLYGPGTESGTFAYFTEAINGEEGASRTDYQASEDDNTLVTGVSGDKYALGYFGYAYYVENKDKLKAVPIDGGKGPVEPTEQTINDGSYSPLSRPVFIYVSSKALAEKPQVKAFVEFYLKEGKELVPEIGYIKLPEEKYEEGLAKINK
ncbi:PstS family phosphate ABC transporter substrate-binding protein [Bacillaceae bacterium]